jgi:hypothetical protein
MGCLLVTAGYGYGTVCAVETIFRVHYSAASTSTVVPTEGKQQWYMASTRKRQKAKIKSQTEKCQPQPQVRAGPLAPLVCEPGSGPGGNTGRHN